MTQLTSRLKLAPSFTVLLGPPSSGKTALVKHVVEQRDKNGPLFHPLQIDLRGTSAISPDSLYESLCASSSTFLRMVKKLMPEIEPTVSLSYLDFRFRFKSKTWLQVGKE